MKKLFLLVLLSAVACGAAAHPDHIYGVRVGMNIANMTFKAGGVSATPNSVVRPLVAFSYEKSLMQTVPLYFETGLGIAGYGTSVADGAMKVSAYYFEAPALVNWHFGLTDDVALIPYLGLSLRVASPATRRPDRRRPRRSATMASTASIWACAPASGWSTAVFRSASATMRASSTSPTRRI